MGPLPAFALLGSPGLLVCKHSKAETARTGRERSMEWSENKIERGKEKEVWKTESWFISDSEVEECF